MCFLVKKGIPVMFNILIIIALIAIYAWTKNLLIAFLVCIILTMMKRSLTPYMKYLWEQYFPAPQFAEFYRRGVKPGENEGKGVRILLVTRQAAIRQEEKAHREEVRRLLTEAFEHWTEKSPAFQQKSKSVEERHLPVHIQTVNSGEKDRNVRKCFRCWLGLPELVPFSGWKENQDLFLYDGIFQEEDCMAAVLFEKGL